MRIQLNGEQHELAAGATVSDLIAGLPLAGRRVAIEVNGSVVPRSDHPGRHLEDGDRVELISAIGGG